SGRKERLDTPVITHRLNNPGEDAVFNRILGIGFRNDDYSHVTVIYVPCYLNGNDGIFDTDYYNLLIGMDATVFPSYYEPWGYTPLESIAFGVPTITTSLSGFGQWILSTTDNQFSSCGVSVIGRGDNNYHQVVDNIARALEYLDESDEDEIALIGEAASKTASRAAWSYFITYYIEAFEVALASRNNRL
ncbi:MAG: glycosyltransferase, partial [Paramuribaculum sp.]|nr:glycosyltransferase [Paramuribaculum sp.]